MRRFNGKKYVDIRTMYQKNGEWAPTKKGIMLTVEQWETLKGNFGKLDEKFNAL